MFPNKKYEVKDCLDPYLRCFSKVMRDKKLTLLQKLILCDVISRKIKGEPYYKTSCKLAQELGTYSPRTIQNAFQWLERNGYINTQPYPDNNNHHQDDLREVEIIQIEQWIYKDEYLEKIGFKSLPLIVKTTDTPTRWRNKKKPKKDIESKIEESVKKDIIIANGSNDRGMSAIENQIYTVSIPGISETYKETPMEQKEKKNMREMPKKVESDSERPLNNNDDGEITLGGGKPSSEKTFSSIVINNDYPVLDSEKDILHKVSIVKKFIETIPVGTKLEYIKANIKFAEDDVMETEVKLAHEHNGIKKYFLKTTLEDAINKTGSFK